MESAARTPKVEDERSGPPFMDSDRASLESWLEFYRQTLPLKIADLSPSQMCLAAVPPSTMTLLGLVRHLTHVERYWFANVVAGQDIPLLYCERDRDGDFNDGGPETALEDVARYHAELPDSRARAAAVADLDAALPGLRHGQQLNLRWVYVHLIEEYARHLGHADLLRECVDGQTGY